MQLTREQARNLSEGGNIFFKVDEGKSAMVRFLYNTMDDMIPYACHSVLNPNGTDKYPVNILCARETEQSSISDCKYCSQGQKIVARYVIPIFNEDTKQIQYWVRTGNFEQKLAAQTEDFNGKEPISGQVFKIIRTGSGRDTNYELIRMGVNDNKTRDSFGEIKSNEEIKALKPGNYDFPATTVQPQPSQMNNNFTSTRRTDMF